MNVAFFRKVHHAKDHFTVFWFLKIDVLGDLSNKKSAKIAIETYDRVDKIIVRCTLSHELIR